jgi:hypothetical protein
VLATAGTQHKHHHHQEQQQQHQHHHQQQHPAAAAPPPPAATRGGVEGQSAPLTRWVNSHAALALLHVHQRCPACSCPDYMGAALRGGRGRGSGPTASRVTSRPNTFN